MLIEQTRILSLEKHLGFLSEEGTEFILGVSLNEEDRYNLQEIGFPNEINNGDTVLPSANIGPVSNYNAEGKYIKHKDKEMETAYMQRKWKWKEFRGPDKRVERSKIVDVPYKRYPRTFKEPPSLELSFIIGEPNIIKINYLFEFKEDNRESIKHGVNLLLEIFERCEVYTEDLEKINRPNIKRLNWKVLPKGKYPWEQLKPKLEEVIKDQPSGKHPVIEKRFEKINKHDPRFIAVGQAGFRGYLIFGFPEDDLYVLESTEYGNATYVLSENWEELSQLTKSQLLNNDLHEQRIIHRESWGNKVDELLA